MPAHLGLGVQLRAIHHGRCIRIEITLRDQPQPLVLQVSDHGRHRVPPGGQPANQLSLVRTGSGEGEGHAEFVRTPADRPDGPLPENGELEPSFTRDGVDGPGRAAADLLRPYRVYKALTLHDAELSVEGP